MATPHMATPRTFRFALAATLLASSLLAAPAASAGTESEYWCATRWMNVRATIVNVANGASTTSDYRISAHACWDHATVWAGSSGQPALTYLAGAGASSYDKGNYLMGDGRRDFYVNLRYLVQCTTFPFTVSNKNWYPRIKVTRDGSFAFEKGTSDGNPCFTLTSQILSHN